jgi:hypothetical protein
MCLNRYNNKDCYSVKRFCWFFRFKNDIYIGVTILPRVYIYSVIKTRGQESVLYIDLTAHDIAFHYCIGFWNTMLADNLYKKVVCLS